jgi:hypothetical protein
MNAEQVDSTLTAVSSEVKQATKNLYEEARQIKGRAYRIDQKGIEKIYVWFHENALVPVQIHSIEVVYRFEYPYDAHRFKQAYFEKYRHSFETEAQAYESPEGITIYLRIVEEPETGKLGNSIYLVTMLNPNEYQAEEVLQEFIY